MTNMRWLMDLVAQSEKMTFPHFPFFGQEQIKDMLRPFLTAERLPHMLLIGEPGMGKTYLSRWIASQRGEWFEELLCPVNPEQLPPNGVVLLDEAHRQRKPEPLFRIMERGSPTILAATTQPEKLDSAFQSRFFLTLRLERYSVDAMADLIRYLLDDIECDDDALQIFARASAGNPRQAHRLVETAKALNSVDPEKVLSTCMITVDGLTQDQLTYLAKVRANEPIGLHQLATLLYDDVERVQQAERYLIELGLVTLGPTGRTLTSTGRRYVQELERRD